MPIHTTPTYRTRTDITDSITPPPWMQERIDRPHGEWKVAKWLPIVWTAYNTTRGTDAYVISSGKVVALDSQERVVPAGLRGKFNKATATTALTYTATDYEFGVIDLTTGVAYATNGTTNYTALQVAKALVERGLVPEDVVSNNPPSSDADVTAIAKAFISTPVGVIHGDVYTYAGKAEDNDQTFANYSQQAEIQFVTEQQMKLPHRVASDTDADAFDVSAITVTTAASAAGDFPQPGEVWDAGALEDLARYSLAGTEPIVALTLASKPVAKNTDRTPISCDIATVLVREKFSIDKVLRAGDWFLDGDVGLLIIHEDTYDTLVTDNTDPTFSYHYYDDAGIGTDSDRYVFFDGEWKPGFAVSIDEHSNFVLKGVAADILASTDSKVGISLFHYKEPVDLLHLVKSQHNLAEMAKTGKMPGTATKGYSDMITLPDDLVADRIVSINVRI